MGAHKEHAHIAVTHRWRHRARLAEFRLAAVKATLDSTRQRQEAMLTWGEHVDLQDVLDEINAALRSRP